MAKQRIAALDDVPEGGNKAFDACGKSVLLCRTGAGVFAIENMCSHAFAHLEGGKVRGPHIFCPLHGVRFDMRTGAPNGTLTKKPIAVYAVSVEDGEIVVDLPDG
ncbi:Rieske 2Fe-2S domain-containing protein [Rhizorhabdus wittichii]|uniref:Rieske 2Fe-2S domain-containing protein n=1 Tax=Rhizorhabdus wittichii TaxID=160791 RepID=A0A975HD81_9SPHN|nr:Rieske 2Fe-2S domain-containing protein [Rhizorhabdus wittichii]QTH20983.1 Rieske 2Fe-2S domain-containing protein [Rhizorhabdus wittichii]